MATQSSTSLAVRGDIQIKKPAPKDRVIWSLYHQRISIEEIAGRYNTTIDKVQQSLNRMEAYRAINSGDEVGLALNAMVLKRIAETDRAVGEALRAKNIIREVDPATGKTVIVAKTPDHTTQMAAAEYLRKVADRNLPKGGGVNVNVQQGVGIVPEGAARGRGFEALLRKAREDSGLTNTDNIVEGEFEDVDESEEDDEETDES